MRLWPWVPKGNWRAVAVRPMGGKATWVLVRSCPLFFSTCSLSDQGLLGLTP